VVNTEDSGRKGRIQFRLFLYFAYLLAAAAAACP